MADLKITELTANTTPALVDLLPMVDDPSGTPLTQKITVETLAGVFSQNSMARQAIMNGNFDVWQRGTSVALADVTTTFQADRWLDFTTKDGGTLPTLTRSRQIITSGGVPNAFYCSRLASNGAGTSLGVNSYHQFAQRIEHGTRMLCGASKTVTVSFYAKSDITNKKIGISLQQNYGTGGSPSTAETIAGTSFTLTSSWTKYTYTFTTNTLSGKTFGTANDDMVIVNFWHIWGDTIGDAFGLTGAETYVGSGFTDIAQVQLCAGDVALPFQPKSFEEELRACMRYCQSRSVAGYEGLGQGNAGSTTVAYIQIPFYTEMRISPALTATAADWRLFDSAGTGYDLTAIAIETGTDSKYIGAVLATVASGLTAFKPYFMGGDNGGTRTLYFDAEL